MTNVVEYPVKDSFPAHVIGIMDYPSGDAAQGDISGLVTNWFGFACAKTWISVDDFSSVEVGFNLASRKIINGDRVHPFTVVLGNAAPRARATKNLEAAPFVTFELQNGVRVFTTLSSEFEEIEFIGTEAIKGPINLLKIPKEGTQFRSSLLPEFAAKYFLSVQNDSQYLASEVLDLNSDLKSSAFAVLKENRPIRILHVDNFGNIKLSITNDDFRSKIEDGCVFEVDIGGKKLPVVKGKHLGDVRKSGDICFYPGSSTLINGNKFMELCLVGDSAAHVFSNPFGLRRFGNRARSGQEVKFNI